MGIELEKTAKDSRWEEGRNGRGGQSKEEGK